MDNKINAYKIIGDTPSIYAEADETRGKFTLALQKDDKTIKVLTDIVCGQVFSITSPGKYTLSVTYKNDVFYSDSIDFYDCDFIKKMSGMSHSSDETINLKTKELVSADIKKFNIEVKINKGKKTILDKIIKKNKDFFDLQKKNIDLSTFSENHSIHNFEYYSLKTNLSSVEATEKCHKMEQEKDIIYISVVPDAEYFVPAGIDIDLDSDVMSSNAALTPDFSHLQTYLDEPHGMNVRKAWAFGNTGKNAILRHVDYGIYKNHEEFKSGNITVITSRSETEDCNHGTASVGCISAADNNSGVTGIAHSSHLYFYDVRDSNKILNDARPGDIISFDIQYKINDQLLPGIAVKAFWDTVKNLTGKGAIVIAAAGNGYLDLSNRRVCPDYGDCGGILVGASNPETGKRLAFSNYAHYTSLINAWGISVMTTGYGDYHRPDASYNRAYTKEYNGTSSATPLCAGALVLLQSHAKSMGVMLNAQSMRKLLKKSSYTEGVIDGIGVRPNVAQLMHELDKEILAPLADVNPFTPASNYLNFLVSFNIDEYKFENIPFNYQYTNLYSNGIIAHYPQQGPTQLIWWNQSKELTPVTVPVKDSKGNITVVYLTVCKWNDSGLADMNSAAGPIGETGMNFRIRLIYEPAKNTHLRKEKYSGVLPVYIKSLQYNDYKLPVKIKILIG